MFFAAVDNFEQRQRKVFLSMSMERQMFLFPALVVQWYIETKGGMEVGFLQGRIIIKKKLFAQTLAFETFVLIVGHKSDLVEMNLCYRRVHSACRVEDDKMMTLPPLLGFWWSSSQVGSISNNIMNGFYRICYVCLPIYYT